MMEDKICNFIKNYIGDIKLKGAIMINGPWGSGKSYYINNTLLPYLRKQCNCNAIKVSVYGLKDISELIKQIYFETKLSNRKIPKNKPSKEAVSGGKIILKGLFSGITSFFNIDLKINDKDLNKLYSSIDLSNKLIVIEDLERTAIDMAELLGYINNLTELGNAKVLLVANENEITTQNVMFNKENQNNEQIYSESAKEYLHIKEKTVSDTIFFELNLDESMDNIIRMFNNDQLTKSFLDNEFKKEVFMKIRSSKHENLRTVIFTFQKCIDIFGLIKKENIDKSIIKKVILNLFDICISLKKGELEKNDLDIISRLDKKYKNTSLYFICEYILYQKIDKETVNNGIICLKKEEELLSKNKYDDDVEIIRSFTFSDDVELLQSINSITSKLENNSLNFFNYDILLYYIILLSDFLDFDLKKMEQLIIKNIKECDEICDNIYLFSYDVSMFTEEKQNEYYSLREEIFNELNKKKKTNAKFNFNNIIEDSKKFSEFCFSNNNEFLKEHIFFGYIDVNKFVKIIVNSRPKDITNYRSAFKGIYNFSNIYDYYKDDIGNLVACIDKLKTLDKKQFSNTKNLILKWLIDDLEEYVINLKNQ